MKNGNFSTAIALRWGHEYLSYLNWIIQKLDSLEYHSLLDVGCGDGKFLYELSQKHADKELVGVDVSERAIHLARAMNPTVQYLSADIMAEQPLGRQFDIVTLIETLEHIPLDILPRFVASLNRCLKDDGVMILTVPTKNIQLNPKHYQHFNLATLSNALTPYFIISDTYYFNRLSCQSVVLQKCLVNRFFILNEPRFRNLLFGYYRRHLFKANEFDGKQLCVLCGKNANLEVLH